MKKEWGVPHFLMAACFFAHNASGCYPPATLRECFDGVWVRPSGGVATIDMSSNNLHFKTKTVDLATIIYHETVEETGEYLLTWDLFGSLFGETVPDLTYTARVEGTNGNFLYWSDGDTWVRSPIRPGQSVEPNPAYQTDEPDDYQKKLVHDISGDGGFTDPSLAIRHRTAAPTATPTEVTGGPKLPTEELKPEVYSLDVPTSEPTAQPSTAEAPAPGSGFTPIAADGAIDGSWDDKVWMIPIDAIPGFFGSSSGPATDETEPADQTPEVVGPEGGNPGEEHNPLTSDAGDVQANDTAGAGSKLTRLTTGDRAASSPAARRDMISWAWTAVGVLALL